MADRLSRRGVAVPAALIAGALAQCTAASATVPPALFGSTARVAVDCATGSATVTPAVAALTSGVSSIMTFSSLKCALIACGLLVAGGFASRPLVDHLHAAHAAHFAPRKTETASAGSPGAAESTAPDNADRVQQFHRFLLSLLPWDVRASHAGDDKKDDKPKPPTGTWKKKDGEMKIEFADKTTLKLSPHGKDDVILIVCEYTVSKDGLVKAKVTGHEGLKKEAIAEKVPVGTEFNFKWKLIKDTATVDEVKGEKAEALKSHLEGEFEEKK